MDCFKFQMVSFLIVFITILAASKADVKHLSKIDLPPVITSSNALTQQDEGMAAKIVNEISDAASSNAPQDPVPFPGPFMPTPGGFGGFGFPNAGNGFPNFSNGVPSNFPPGAVPNFPQQANFQGFPGAGFQPAFNQVPFGYYQPGLGFNQPGNGAYGQPQFQQVPQFGNQAFAGQAFPGGFQAPQFVGPNVQQPGVQQPFFPQSAAGLEQPDFGPDHHHHHHPSNDEVDTVYGSNGGYVYEKPSNKF